MDNSIASDNGNPLSRFGLIAGLVTFVVLILIGPPAGLLSAGYEADAWVTLALLLLMAIWWVSEAVPIPVTSLLPLIVLPLFGVLPIAKVAAPYMHPIVVLLMGGFIFAKAIERWGLHERIALHVVNRAGGSPMGLIGGFMVASALLSMWISNSATSIMMMPIAISVSMAIENDGDDNQPFTVALLLGIAYACSIGGLGTPIGTPTNLIVMGYLSEQNGIEISFAQWMLLGLPAVGLLLPIAWLVLTKFSFDLPKLDASAAKEKVSHRLKTLGKISVPERRTLTVFCLIAFMWMFRRLLNSWEFTLGDVIYTPLSGLTDHMTAIIAVVLCFLIPAGSEKKRGEKLLDWKAAEEIPWGVLLLFGGGMSLALAITSSGLSAFIGSGLSIFFSLPIPVLILIVALMVLALTEVTSNIATASALMPVLGAIAIETGLPIEMMAAPLALAASCAFMLPMATGPNAVVFATGKVSLSTMAKTGFKLNLLALAAISLLAYFIAPLALA